nr:anti-sigma factor [Pseudactinotalea sp. HY160]
MPGGGLVNDPRVTADLLAAWALDAVEPAERALVEHAISADPGLAREARALRETVAALAAQDAVPAPEHVRAAVLRAVATEPQQDSGPVDERPPIDLAAASRRHGRGRQGEQGGRGWRIARWAAAAAVVAAIAVPTGIAVQESRQAEAARDRASSVIEALARPGATLYAQDVAGGGRAVVVAAGGRGLFVMRGVPPAGSGRTYQLWAVGAGGAVSEGIIELRAGTARTDVDRLAAGTTLAVTIEPAGGSPQPTTEPVVAIDLAG